jgi:hypothetical protein
MRKDSIKRIYLTHENSNLSLQELLKSVNNHPYDYAIGPVHVYDTPCNFMLPPKIEEIADLSQDKPIPDQDAFRKYRERVLEGAS